MKAVQLLSQYIPKLSIVLYIILFIYAASSKLIDFENFKTQLGQSPTLTAYAGFIAVIIPLVELIIATLFLSLKYSLLAFELSFSLMVMFTTYIFLTLNFSDYIPCSCGGVLETLSWNEHIIFNLVFVFLAVWSILIIKRNVELQKIVSYE